MILGAASLCGGSPGLSVGIAERHSAPGIAESLYDNCADARCAVGYERAQRREIVQDLAGALSGGSEPVLGLSPAPAMLLHFALEIVVGHGKL